MGTKSLLLGELESETANTRRILERLTDEHLDWRPHEKSMSVKSLAHHIVGLHNWIYEALPKAQFDLQVDFKPAKVTSIADLKAMLESGFALNKKMIEEASPESWEEEWTLKTGDYIIAKVNRAAGLRFIINNHLIHHRGQLTVYLRLLGIPVPGLYGPSADEHNG